MRHLTPLFLGALVLASAYAQPPSPVIFKSPLKSGQFVSASSSNGHYRLTIGGDGGDTTLIHLTEKQAFLALRNRFSEYGHGDFSEPLFNNGKLQLLCHYSKVGNTYQHPTTGALVPFKFFDALAHTYKNVRQQGTDQESVSIITGYIGTESAFEALSVQSLQKVDDVFIPTGVKIQVDPLMMIEIAKTMNQVL